MASVYSVVMFDGNVDHETFVVGPPVGYAWVIRDIVAGTTESYGDPHQVVIAAASSSVIIAVLDLPDGAPAYAHWQGRQIIEQGDSIAVVVVDEVSYGVRICGYQLTLP